MGALVSAGGVALSQRPTLGAVRLYMASLLLLALAHFGMTVSTASSQDNEKSDLLTFVLVFSVVWLGCWGNAGKSAWRLEPSVARPRTTRGVLQ